MQVYSGELVSAYGLMSSISLKLSRSSCLMPFSSACLTDFSRIPRRLFKYFSKTGIVWL